MRTLRVFVALLIAGSSIIEVDAQTTQAKPQPPRPFVENGFVSLNAGGLFASDQGSERILFEANAETGTLDADYPGGAAPVFDGAFGLLVHRQIGVGLSVSRSSRSGSALVRAQVPHPFFDNRHRAVEGDATDMNRSETAVHAQIYYELRHRGPWRVRVFAGPAYVRVEQALVTGVDTQETYPFDTAEFRRAITQEAKGSGFGVGVGLDVSRMFTRRAGLGAVVRYTAASIDLNAPGGSDVSTDAGGLTAGLGLRVAF